MTELKWDEFYENGRREYFAGIENNEREALIVGRGSKSNFVIQQIDDGCILIPCREAMIFGPQGDIASEHCYAKGTNKYSERAFDLREKLPSIARSFRSQLADKKFVGPEDHRMAQALLALARKTR